MAMPTRIEYLQRPLEQRLERLARTPDELAAAIEGRGDDGLSRRPDPGGWSAKDVVCHLRDVEELVILRLHTMLAMDEPKVLGVGSQPTDAAAWGFGGDVPFPLDPDRWREERQYERNDPHAALAAFRRRRGEVLALLASLSPEQWRRGAIHPSGERWTFEDWTAGTAGHDDSHLEQLRQSLAS
jgi:hypothetical protein